MLAPVQVPIASELVVVVADVPASSAALDVASSCSVPDSVIVVALVVAPVAFATVAASVAEALVVVFVVVASVAVASVAVALADRAEARHYQRKKRRNWRFEELLRSEDLFLTVPSLRKLVASVQRYPEVVVRT